MKKFKMILMIAIISVFFTFPMFAVDSTTIKIGGLTVKVPNDLVEIVNENKDSIEAAFKKYNVTQNEINNIEDKVLAEYDKFKSEYGFETDNPYTTAKEGLDDFIDNLGGSIINTQTLQNVWAESWIGMLIPNAKFGFGINAGLAALDISPLKDAADALAIDEAKDLRNTLAFPTVTADLRLGGFFLPFDVGFTASAIDSTKIGALDEKITPCEFDYYSIGGDLRYCIFKMGTKHINTRISVSGGGYYTKGSVKLEEKDSSNSSASLDFSAATLFLGAQANAKFFCFVPFLGGKVAVAKSKVNWKVHADWLNILEDDSNGYVSKAIAYNILPSDFGEDVESEWSIHPQIYGGLGIDLFVINITVSGSYDFVKQIPGAAASVRFAL